MNDDSGDMGTGGRGKTGISACRFLFVGSELVRQGRTGMNSGTTDRNINAVKLLVGELLSDSPFNREDLRIAYRSVVFTCFQMEIEPYQLPLSDHYSGILTDSQRKEFMKQFFYCM